MIVAGFGPTNLRRARAAKSGMGAMGLFSTSSGISLSTMSTAPAPAPTSSFTAPLPTSTPTAPISLTQSLSRTLATSPTPTTQVVAVAPIVAALPSPPVLTQSLTKTLATTPTATTTQPIQVAPIVASLPAPCPPGMIRDSPTGECYYSAAGGFTAPISNYTGSPVQPASVYAPIAAADPVAPTTAVAASGPSLFQSLAKTISEVVNPAPAAPTVAQYRTLGPSSNVVGVSSGLFSPISSGAPSAGGGGGGASEGSPAPAGPFATREAAPPPMQVAGLQVSTRTLAIGGAVALAALAYLALRPRNRVAPMQVLAPVTAGGAT